MVNKMVNRYLYTAELNNKFSRLENNYYLVFYLINDIVLFLISLIAFLVFGELLFLILMFIEIFSAFVTVFVVKGKIKKDVDEYNKIFGNQPPYFCVEFRENIYTSFNGVVSCIPYENIISFVEFDDFIDIKLKGKMKLPLKKDAFIEGSYEECITFLKNICKKK